MRDRCALTRKGGHLSHRTGRTVDLDVQRKVNLLTSRGELLPATQRSKIQSTLKKLSEEDSAVQGCFLTTDEGHHMHLWLHSRGLAGRLDSMLVRAQEGRECFSWAPW